MQKLAVIKTYNVTMQNVHSNKTTTYSKIKNAIACNLLQKVHAQNKLALKRMRNNTAKTLKYTRNNFTAMLNANTVVLINNANNTVLYKFTTTTRVNASAMYNVLKLNLQH